MKSCWCAAIIVATIGSGSGAAIAQSWPTKPIRAFIPFAAGSATDIVPRAVFEPVGAELGQSIIVENRGGAGGTIGMGAVVRADPDGYTILANSSAHTIAPWIVPNFPFDLTKDLSSVLMIGQNANILIVSPAKGWKTVQDLVAAAKAKPGSINYGSAGVGTATHIAAEKFRVAAGFEAIHVAYKGGAEALADIVAGRIDFYYCPISTALPFIEDKRVLALAASTSNSGAGASRRADLSRCGLSELKPDHLVRSIHAVADSAYDRREIPCGGHEGAGHADAAAKAQAARD